MRRTLMILTAALAGCPASERGGAGESLPLWTEPRALPTLNGSADGVIGNNMFVTASGRITILYPIRWTGSYKLYRAVSTNEGATWTAAEFIEPEARAPNVATDDAGKVHLTYVRSDRLYYRSSADGGETWTDEVLLSGSATPASYGFISVDRNFNVHVTYHVGDGETTGEVYYARSRNNGSAWDASVLLSRPDGKLSLYPRADFTGSSGQKLIIVWRDRSGENNPNAGPDWDIRGALSFDGGDHWEERLIAGGALDQWDPMSMVDADDRMHVAFMDPTPGNLIDTEIKYAGSPDGTDWNWRQLTEVQSRFPFFTYDRGNHVVWLFWKDERDMDQTTGNRQADIAGRFSKDGGATWSDLEFVTDNGTIETRFPAFTVTHDGIVHAIHSRGESGEAEPYTVYYQRRTQAP